MVRSRYARLIWTLSAKAALAVAVLVTGRPVAAQSSSEPLSFEQQLLKEQPASLAEEARQQGDARRGAITFHQPHLACTKCHAAEEKGPLGPGLARLPEEVTRAHVVESLLRPSEKIREGYAAHVVTLHDGRTLTGLLEEETDEHLVLRNAEEVENRVEIPKEEIEEHRRAEQSIMPSGLVNQLAGRQEFLDLTCYLIEIAEGGPAREKQLKPPESLYAPPPTAPDTSQLQVQVYRTMMPQSGPASLAIGLGEGIWVCFDPQRGGINYAWQGRLELAPTVAEKINNPAEIEGTIFYRETKQRPLRPGEPSRLPELKFRGYRFLDDEAVELRYRLDGLLVRDRFQRLRDGDHPGVLRRILVEQDDDPLWLVKETDQAGRVKFPSARQGEDQEAWRLEPDESGAITMVIEHTGPISDNENSANATKETP